jgi:two-component system C4-dicarboxylate transport sensor histidine kinase DctB
VTSLPAPDPAGDGAGEPARELPAALRLGASDELFDNNPFAYFLVHTAGVIAKVNRSFQRITGFSTADLAGRTLEELLSRRDVEEFYGYHRAKLRYRDRTFEYECGVLDAAGRELRAVITMNIVVDDGFGLGALRDVTEERRLSDELRRRNAELQQTSTMLQAAQEELHASTQTATIGEISGQVAHEILNPLTAVTAKVARLTARAGQLPELAAHLRRAAAAPSPDTAAILAAVADVLDEQHRDAGQDLALVASELGRIEGLVHGMRRTLRPDLARTRLSLDEVLRYCDEVMAAAVARAGTTYHWSCPADVYVEVDRGEIIQAVTNLMRNALEAHEALAPGSPRLLAVTVEVRADVATILVADSGAGVPEELAPRIFEPSFTTKPAGTGLGLAISRRLVRLHGGDLILARRGPGATFALTLPCAVVATARWEG